MVDQAHPQMNINMPNSGRGSSQNDQLLTPGSGSVDKRKKQNKLKKNKT